MSVFSSNQIAADERIPGDAVAVMGDNTVDGFVGHDVVTVMGRTVGINGTVGHNVVATMGDVVSAPTLWFGGDVVRAGGHLRCPPGSDIRGRLC